MLTRRRVERGVVLAHLLLRTSCSALLAALAAWQVLNLLALLVQKYKY
jgi:hypothetical protein